MNIKKVIEYINERTSFVSYSYKHMADIKKLIIEDKLPFDLKSVKSNQSPLSYYLTDIEKYKEEILYFVNNKNNWSTYDKCTETRLRVKDNKIIATVFIYNGDLLYGSKQDLKFSLSLEVSESFVLANFSDLINHYINQIAQEDYYKQLEIERTKAIKELADKIIKNLS